MRSRSSSWPSSSRSRSRSSERAAARALCVRRVALVHVRRDVVEQQCAGEGRRGLGLHLDEAELARVQSPQDLLEARDVEHVAQALPVGLEDDREVRVALGDLEERLALQPLLPQRRAPAGVRARDQQRAAGVLAEARAEQRGGAELPDHEFLELVGRDQDELRAGRFVRVGEMDDDPVVGVDRVGLQAVGVADPRGERKRPRRVHPPAVRAEDAQPPVADLVAEAFDDEGAIRGTMRVASCCSRRKSTRFRAARGSRS